MDHNFQKAQKLRRSVLYVPADNPRAVAKSLDLNADCIIYDLEDAVAPDRKAAAREALRDHFKVHQSARAERLIRINPLVSEFGTEDLMCVRACVCDGVVLPKVDSSKDILAVSEAFEQMDAPDHMQIFAMIETAQGILNIADIAVLGALRSARLACFIVGLNDIVKETRISTLYARRHAHSWLMQIVLAARVGGIDVIDAVYNDFRDIDGFVAECAAGVEMGFDGKSLIHPAQIDGANNAFMPSEVALSEANAIVNAFALPENHSKVVIQLDGKMVELLHLEQAKALLAKAEMVR